MKSNPAKISILMPSFNQGRYLEAAIQSVLSQDYPNKELIVIDGGSTDVSTEVIRRYQPDLAYSISEPDRGQAHALNKALAHATGDLIGWLNSDDLYLPGAFARVAKAFAQNPDAILVHGNRVMIDSNSHVSGWTILPAFDPANTGYVIASETAFWRKDLCKNQRFDEDLQFSMDLDYFCRLYHLGRFVNLDNYLGSFRCHIENKSSTLHEVGQTEGTRCWKTIFPEYPDGFTKKYKLNRAKQLLQLFHHPFVITFPYLYRRFWLGLRGVS